MKETIETEQEKEYQTPKNYKVFSYKCEGCKKAWNMFLQEEDRTIPQKNPCPFCHKETKIIRALCPPKFKEAESADV